MKTAGVKKWLKPGIALLILAITLTAQAAKKDKPAPTPKPTSNPATVLATIGDKQLTYGDLQALKKFSGASDEQNQALINMWKINMVLANKARQENFENDPEAKSLLKIAQDQVLVSIYMRLKLMNTNVTDREVKEYYEKHKNDREFRERDSITATLIAAKNKPDLDKIKKELVNGADFDKLAEANRDQTLKTPLMTDINIKNVPAEELSKKLGAPIGYSMAGAPIGEVRGPQGIPNGWILYKITARTPGKSLSLEKIAGDLKKMLSRQKQSTAKNALIEAAQKEAGVAPGEPGGLNSRMNMKGMAPRGKGSMKPRP